MSQNWLKKKITKLFSREIRGAVLSKKLVATLIISIMLIAFLFAIERYIPNGIDWQWTFRPAAIALFSGKSPYTDTSVRAPYAGAPWGLLPVIPLALLPEKTGRVAFLGLSFIMFALAAVRLGAKPPALIAFLVSPPVLHSLLNSNLDWMPLLGYSLPPQIGIFFLAVKPQMGSAWSSALAAIVSLNLETIFIRYYSGS